MADGLESVTDETFADRVEKSDAPYLVEFTAPWCAPCVALEPVLAEVAAIHADRLRVGQLNIADSPDSAARYGVLSTPTMILFKNGEPVRRLMGAKNKRNLLEALGEYLD